MDFENALAKLKQFGEKNQPASFDIFFNETKEVVYRVAYHYMRCGAEAEDILQSVYLKIFTYAQEKPEKIKEIVNLKSWMIQIAVNVSKMSIRTKIRLREKNMKKVNETSSYSTEKQELYDQVKKYLSDLPEKYRLPVCLHYVENMSFAEIASVLKIDQPTVKVQASRGIAKLKEILQKAGVAVTSSTLSSVLIESSFQKAPANISFLKPSLPISTRLEQVMGYADKPAWYANKMVIFAICSSAVILLLPFLYFSKEKNITQTSPDKSIEKKMQNTYIYNFEQNIPAKVQVNSLNNKIEKNKGLVIPKKESSSIEYSEIKYGMRPFSLNQEMFIDASFTYFDSLIGDGNKKMIWNRPGVYTSNAWNQFKIIFYDSYEIVYIHNNPVWIKEIPTTIKPDENIKIGYENLIIKEVTIQPISAGELEELSKFVSSKINAKKATLTKFNASDFVKSRHKGIYLLPNLNDLKKPIEITIEMAKPVPVFEAINMYFLDSKDSLTEKIYTKVPSEYGDSKFFHVFIYDEICFISKENEKLSIVFESNSKELMKEIGFELDLSLVRKVQVNAVQNTSDLFEQATNVFMIRSGKKYIQTKAE